jgi:hypothetical protein
MNELIHADDPFVESGNKWMGFYWKDGKDQLLARSGDLPPGQTASQTEKSTTGHPWTTFTMALREPAPLEAPLDFARFLVTSLTFMRAIKHIDMIVDDTKVLSVRKDIKGQSGVSRPGLNATSSMGMMKIQGVDATSMLITARVMKWLSGELLGTHHKADIQQLALPPPPFLRQPCYRSRPDYLPPSSDAVQFPLRRLFQHLPQHHPRTRMKLISSLVRFRSTRRTSR